MSAVTSYSTALSNAKAVPRVRNSNGLEHGVVRRAQGLVAISNGDSIGSIYAVSRVRSCDFMDRIRIDFPDIGTTTAADVGLYAINSDGSVGAAVDQDHYASAVALNSGPYSNVDTTFEAGAAGGSLTNAEKRVWETLGLSADPGIDYYLCLTLTAAADAAGTGLVRVYTVC